MKRRTIARTIGQVVVHGKVRMGFFEELEKRRVLSRWKKAAEDAVHTPLSELRDLSEEAHELRAYIDQVTVSHKRRKAVEAQKLPKPKNSDWVSRPELWMREVETKGLSPIENGARFGTESIFFHDCPHAEMVIHQVRNPNGAHSPFAVQLEVFQYKGSFMSLVIDLPAEAVDGLTRDHLVELVLAVETERPMGLMARLNVRHGPNTEQLPLDIDLSGAIATAGFDLAYSNLNEKRVEKAWIDLFFQNPENNQITIRDMTLSRRIRAAL